MIRTTTTRKKKDPDLLMLHQVFELARFGYTNQEIADFFKISVGTVEYRSRTQPEFFNALQEGRLLSGLKVVDSVHKEACGYEYVEVYDSYTVGKDGVNQLTSHKVIKKYARPNILAAIYLLKVRHGDKWMDIYKAEITKNIKFDTDRPDLSGLTEKEKQFLKNMGLKQLPMIINGSTNN